MLDVKALLTKMLNAVKVDYIIEQGTSGIWTYRKWNSGIAECWGERSVNSASYSSWGSIYSFDVLGVAYPTGLFNTTPNCIAQVSASGNTVSSINSSGGSNTTTPSVTAIRGTTASAGSVKVRYQAIGTWK